MNVINRYQELIQQGVINEDKAQLAALSELQSAYDALLQEHKKRGGISKLWRKPKTIQGLYLYGGVGIGKTLLLDCFYQALPFKQKLRQHFYEFMQFVHNELRGMQGAENPLKILADNIASKTMVLCFDEFIITDVVDALVLKNLLVELFARGVCIVSTSNVAPDNLCKKAWQEPFAPALAAIKQYMQIMHVEGVIDYRKAITVANFNKPVPAQLSSQQQLSAAFSAIAKDRAVTEKPIELFSRSIPVIKRADNIIWFDFAELCSVPRSAQDYLALTKQYKTIMVSNIPIIPAFADNAISLFIRLVDILYDAKVKLLFSSKVPVDQIYTEGKLAFDYARTCSRLLHMQSKGV